MIRMGVLYFDQSPWTDRGRLVISFINGKRFQSIKEFDRLLDAKDALLEGQEIKWEPRDSGEKPFLKDR